MVAASTSVGVIAPRSHIDAADAAVAASPAAAVATAVAAVQNVFGLSPLRFLAISPSQLEYRLIDVNEPILAWWAHRFAKL